MEKTQNKSLDGVKAVRVFKVRAPVVSSRIVPVFLPIPSRKAPWFRHITRRQAYLFIAVLGFVATFGLGMVAALRTPRSGAEDEAVIPPTITNYQIPLPDARVATEPPAVSNEVLFNTPIGMLQEYLARQDVPDVLLIRKTKLKQYLESRKSPLAGQADFIAEQAHWKLILAISFAESTLGEHCYYNNCSGIGGSNIRTYKTLEDWITDFNRLLEKRYKDQTLEQMCGVYVQPCNPNWLLATKQILDELKEEGIE